MKPGRVCTGSGKGTTWPPPPLLLQPPAPARCRCEYPVSDRGNAVRHFFDLAATNASMLRVREVEQGCCMAGVALLHVCGAAGVAAMVPLCRRPCRSPRPGNRCAATCLGHCSQHVQGEWIYMIESDYVFMKVSEDGGGFAGSSARVNTILQV